MCKIQWINLGMFDGQHLYLYWYIKMKNRLFESFLLVFTALLFFLVISFTDTEKKILNYDVKRTQLFSDVLSLGKAKQVPLLTKALNDSIVKKTQQQIVLRNQDPATIIEFSKDSTGGLSCFFEALRKTKKNKRKIRVAYFGDSMIEGDLITQDLRRLLQEQFGGEGVGFVPITSIVAGFRQTIIHSFSPNWHNYNLLDPVSEKHTLGISGYVFEPSYYVADVDTSNVASESGGSWVKYTSVNQKRLNKFTDVKLFYGMSEGNNYITYNQQQKKLDGKNAVNELVLNSANPIKSIAANFVCQSPVNIYGFSFESDSGIYIDNFSFRGNSGMPLTKIPQKVLSGLNNYLDYDLVVLQYGVNVVNHNVKDYTFYETGMKAVVDHFKSCFPNASVLIVGAGDKGLRQNGVYSTDPAVPLVVDAQKKVAEKTNSAFWNLYESMGGNNSMVSWVQGDTVYANKDYTHFNFRGANKVATMLYRHLTQKYDEYNKKKVKLG